MASNRRILLGFLNSPQLYIFLLILQTGSVEAKEINFACIKKAVSDLMGEQIEFAFLLGSAGTERFREESDIDLAVYFKEPPDFEKLSQLSFELFNRFNRDCDLVALNNIDPIYARQVIETGRKLLIPNQEAYHLWVAEQLSRYPDFKASRAVIEKNLLNRKKYV